MKIECPVHTINDCDIILTSNPNDYFFIRYPHIFHQANTQEYKFRNHDDEWVYELSWDIYILINFRLRVVYEIYNSICFERACCEIENSFPFFT